MRTVLEVLVLTSLVGPVFLQADEPVITGPPVDSTRAPAGMEDWMKRLQTTRRRVHRRTTPPKVSFPENCDYLAFYCLKAFITGKVCAKSVRSTYYTFKNYCMLDYVNCMERYDLTVAGFLRSVPQAGTFCGIITLWQPVYMGECIEIQPLEEYGHYPYDDDLFLDQYYIIEDV